VPVALELDESRWELGAFRMTNAQRYREDDRATNPYWGFTAMRRWQVLHRSPGRLLELGIHHWSNFWIKQPNRGQDFLMLSFGF
jgi:hypothetical protein